MQRTLFPLSLSVATALLLCVTPCAAADGEMSPSENLSRVLEQAKNSGMLIDKSSTQNTNKNMGEVSVSSQSMAVGSAAIGSASSEPFYTPSCISANALDFSALREVASYKEIRKFGDEQGGALSDDQEYNQARVYLSLGLGVEAKALLSNIDREEAALLRRVADLIENPSGALSSIKFSDYSDCGEVASLWALFEQRGNEVTEVSGEQLRSHIDTLSKFPRYLADRMIVNIAIENAEYGDARLAKSLWNLIENRAIQNADTMPEERSFDDDYLYLWALLNTRTQTSRSAGIFEFISEKDSVLRGRALQNIVKVNALKGLVPTSNVKANLLEVSRMIEDKEQSEAAAIALIGYFVDDAEFTEAIDMAKARISASSKSYLNAVNTVGAGVLEIVASEELSQQILGLNSFFHAPGFFEQFNDIEALKLAIVKASVDTGLPSLASQVYDEGLKQSSEAAMPLNSAQILTHLSKGDVETAAALATKYGAEDALFASIAEHAMTQGSLGISRKMTTSIADGPLKTELFDTILWLETNWSELESTEKAELSDSDSGILSLLAGKKLTSPLLNPSASTSERVSDNLPAYFTQLEGIMMSAREYLNHG